MAKAVIKPLTNRQVIAQSNKIFVAKYDLTEAEQKIILLAIAQIDSKNDKKIFTYKATIPELEQKLGISLNQGQLKETCRKLMQRVVYLENSKGWKMFHWVSRAEYLNGENTIEFKISDEMKPYLLKLKDNFTKIELEYALKFSGKYTLRFYQFCMQIQNQMTKSKALELSKLYELLQLPKTLKSDFTKFRTKVLDPSIDEINEKSNIKAKYEITAKQRKKITEITLSWNYKSALEAQKDNANKSKNLSKYKNKEFLYFNSIYKIENIVSNTDKNRIEATFQYSETEKSRADFSSIDELERAIREAKILKADMKANPQRYEKHERQLF